MSIFATCVFLGARLALGWYFFHAGILKVLDPAWSARSFLEHASMFPDVYLWFTHPAVLPVVDFLNAWGITAVGVALLLGVGTRIAVWVGVVLMVLYYFPHAPGHTYIVDDHVVIVLLLLCVYIQDTGRMWSLRFLLPKIGIPLTSRTGRLLQ